LGSVSVKVLTAKGRMLHISFIFKLVLQIHITNTYKPFTRNLIEYVIKIFVYLVNCVWAPFRFYKTKSFVTKTCTAYQKGLFLLI
jgi:hypothetical protein